MLMAEQIQEHLSYNNLLSDFQSGFRPGHSCATALMKVIDDIRENYDDDLLTLLCLLDFTKAFDRVVFHILIQKLGDQFGFNTFALRLIANYLTDRCQRVKINDKYSEYRCIKSGVPQGSILGPILFTMFINDIFTVVENCSIHGYADDVQLYLSRRMGLIEDLTVRVNEDLNKIHDWAIKNKLSLNASKSCVLPIAKFNIYSNLPPVSIGDSQIEVVQRTVNLGFVMNSTLSCADHINSVVSKIYYRKTVDYANH